MNLNYPKNLHFTCNRCGLCCGDTPKKQRHVLMLKAEAEHIAAQTNQQIAEFADESSGTEPYVYEVHKTPEGKCVFLQNDLCRIYELRPLICRFYPFKLETTPENADFSATTECPSISKAKTTEADVIDDEFFKHLLQLAQSRLCPADTV